MRIFDTYVLLIIKIVMLFVSLSIEYIEQLVSDPIRNIVTFCLSIISYVLVGKIDHWGLNKILIENTRVWPKLIVSSLLVMAMFIFPINKIGVIVFILLLLCTIVFPLPHEWILLKVIKRWPKKYNNKKFKRWIVTTPALIRVLNLDVFLSTVEDKQLASYNRIQKLKSLELFPFEIKRYYLSKLNVLFEIGAIKELNVELQNLVKYKDEKNYIYLRILIAFGESNYDEMYHYCELLENDEFVETKTKVVAIINEACASQNSGDDEKYKVKIQQLENLFKDGEIWIPELYHDLMLYYDNNEEHLKANSLAKKLEDNAWEDLQEHFKYKDILLQHYKVNHNMKRCQELILELQEYSKQHEKDEEQRAICALRFLPLYFEYEMDWQNYSSEIFKNCDYYLNLSPKVGVEFITQTNRISQLAIEFYGIGINERGCINLYTKFKNKYVLYNQAIDQKLSSLNDAFLYQKISLLMAKTELESAVSMLAPNIADLGNKRERLFDRMVELCDKVGDKRELLHMLNVYIDEIITSHKNLEEDLQNNPSLKLTPDITMYFENWSTLRNKALNALERMTQLIEKNNFNLSYSYYILYAAYLYCEIGNIERSKYFLYEFEKYKVDYHLFALSTQRIYLNLKERLGSN